MLSVGLTGGVGAGKSQVSRLLDSHGAVIIDADRIAREVVEPGTEGLAAVVAAFGEEILTPDGRLDRSRLGSIVFNDREKLKALNTIIHPLVGARSEELQKAAGEHAIVVHDVPLLVENDLTARYDVVVVVDASPQTRIDRLVHQRGMDEADVRSRMAAQATRERRLAAADIVIDNDGSLAELEAQVAKLWQQLCERARTSGAPGRR